MPDDTHNDDDLKPTELPPTETVEPTDSPQDRIGPYKLLDKLGEGGMGEVWLAEQQEPVKRKVALKVIKQGMDTKQVVARFEAERQALAMMDHPAIAKVYEAGATPRGRPYFVMEHVKGVPITEHCDRHKLTNTQRLDLFMQACEGVQHAHQKAIIHRDLKPANVLVSVQDGKATPKIIDFGVAKATAQSLTDKTMHTQLGVMIGTPAYMSPEQAEMTGQDIDTRTDVYALGVILYELMVGALPFDMKDLQQAGFEAMVRKIREDEPPKPSTRLSTLGEHSTQSAKKRQTELPALKRELTGDLDWITLKCLEKDRNRRYGSPSELAADIQRYLTDQPVLATPPSAGYRAKKFIRRHSAGVAAAALGVLVLVAFAATMAVQAKRIAAERDRANVERARAAKEAKARGQVSEFMKELFTISDPGEARGNSITARELLDVGAEKMDTMLLEQPEIRAELMATMGDVYTQLGLYPQAEPLLDKALDERKRVLGDDHPHTLSSMGGLADLYGYQGRYDEAEPIFLQTLEAQKRVLGDDHPDTLTSMNNLALLYTEQGRYDEAETLYRQTLETQKRVLGDDHPETLTSMNNLANLYLNQGRYDEAEPIYRQTLETLKRVLGDDHPYTLKSMNNLASLYLYQGRYDEAEPLIRQTLETQKRVLGDDHPETLTSLMSLGFVYKDQGRYDEAETLYRQALETEKRVLGDDHPSTTVSMGNLGELYVLQGRPQKAEALLKKAVEIETRTLSREHIITGVTIRKHGVSLTALNRHTEAEATLLEAHEILTAAVGADHGQTLKVVRNLADLYEAWGKPEKAAEWRAKLPEE